MEVDDIFFVRKRQRGGQELHFKDVRRCSLNVTSDTFPLYSVDTKGSSRTPAPLWQDSEGNLEMAPGEELRLVTMNGGPTTSQNEPQKYHLDVLYNKCPDFQILKY